MREDDVALGAMLVFLFILLALIALMITSLWKVFEKAGKPGWAAIVPIYNLVVWTEIIRKPGYWVLLMLIPYVGIIWSIWATNLLVKSFGKDEGFTVGCILLPYVFYPILGFGDAQYVGLPGWERPQLQTREDVLDDMV